MTALIEGVVSDWLRRTPAWRSCGGVPKVEEGRMGSSIRRRKPTKLWLSPEPHAVINSVETYGRTGSSSGGSRPMKRRAAEVR